MSSSSVTIYLSLSVEGVSLFSDFGLIFLFLHPIVGRSSLEPSGSFSEMGYDYCRAPATPWGTLVIFSLIDHHHRRRHHPSPSHSAPR